MSFDVIEEIKQIAQYVDGKMPTDIEDYLHERVHFFEKNGIMKDMHIGKDGEWTKKEIAEWLASMFNGSVNKAKENKIYYNTLGTWLKYVNHYITNDNLPT